MHVMSVEDEALDHVPLLPSTQQQGSLQQPLHQVPLHRGDSGTAAGPSNTLTVQGLLGLASLTQHLETPLVCS